MRILVTGGAGFIGGNLIKRLTESKVESFEVRVLDNLSTGDRRNLPQNGESLFVEDLLDRDALISALDGVDSVVHLAARPSVPRSIENPLASHQVNATGTLLLLEAMREVGVLHIIAASSSSVYGSNPHLPKHEGLKPSPRSPYAASKLAMESYVLAHGASFGFSPLAFRFFNVFGPLQSAGHAYAAVIPAFISAALEGRALPVHGDGRQTRDFTFVDSVTAVIEAALVDRVEHPEPVNLAFGSRRALLEVIEALEGLLDHELVREHLPPRPGDVRDSQADQSRLSSLFPTLDPVPFTDGLRQTVSWFQAGGAS